MKRTLLALLLAVCVLLCTGCVSERDITGRWTCRTEDGRLTVLLDNGWYTSTLVTDAGETHSSVWHYRFANSVLMLYHPHTELTMSYACFFSGDTLVMGGLRLTREE